MDSKTASYFKSIYPGNYGSEYVATFNKTKKSFRCGFNECELKEADKYYDENGAPIDETGKRIPGSPLLNPEQFPVDEEGRRVVKEGSEEVMSPEGDAEGVPVQTYKTVGNPGSEDSAGKFEVLEVVTENMDVAENKWLPEFYKLWSKESISTPKVSENNVIFSIQWPEATVSSSIVVYQIDDKLYLYDSSGDWYETDDLDAVYQKLKEFPKAAGENIEKPHE